MAHVRLAALTLTLAVAACKTPAPGSDASLILEEGSDRFDICTGPRPFFGSSSSAFDFTSRTLDYRNAFWLATMASHAYVKKDVVVPELRRLGFTDAEFFDEDGVAKNVLRTGINFRWASTQGFWADAPAGVILAFRGTVPTEMGDLFSDIWATQKTFDVGTAPLGELDNGTRNAADEMAAGAAQTGVDATSIHVHKGFWYALDIVWKHVERRAKAHYATERPKEIAAKKKRLDEWAALLSSGGGEAALKQKLALETDWVIEPSGKLNLVKQWVATASDAARRSELFELIDSNWANWQKPIFVTGHSLGGALATLASYRLMKMGLNVRGLYTYGSPRAGNAAFVHDFRVRAFRKGLKLKGKSGVSGEGGLQRFVDHNDVVARIPPVFGWPSAIDDSILNPMLDRWKHVSRMRYLTGRETEKPEAWLEGDAEFDERVAAVPQYTIKLPLEGWKQWVGDHSMVLYAGKLERIAFGTTTTCN